MHEDERDITIMIFLVLIVLTLCLVPLAIQDYYISKQVKVDVRMNGVLTVYYHIGMNETEAIETAAKDLYGRQHVIYDYIKKVWTFQNISGSFIAVKLIFIIHRVNITVAIRNSAINYTFVAYNFTISITGKINANITVPAQIGTYTYHLEGKL